MRRSQSSRLIHPTLVLWLAVGWVGFCLVPWYGIEDGFLTTQQRIFYIAGPYNQDILVGH